MIHLKKYEGWKDIFKSKEYDMYQQFMISTLEDKFGTTYPMSAASDGDLKKFKYYLNSEDKVNKQDKEGSTTLMYVAAGKGTINDKANMIWLLINKGEDPFIVDNNGKTFYEMIKEPELKKWLNDTYPQFEFETRESAKKYNL